MLQDRIRHGPQRIEQIAEIGAASPNRSAGKTAIEQGERFHRSHGLILPVKFSSQSARYRDAVIRFFLNGAPSFLFWEYPIRHAIRPSKTKPAAIKEVTIT
jgi:hypothetical protein